MNPKSLVMVFVGGLIAAVTPAQSTPSPATPNSHDFMAVLQSHAVLATAVAKNTIDVPAALSQLRAQVPLVGANGDRDLDFGQAALDVGRRLIALGQPRPAESFFKAAETVLRTAVAVGPDLPAAHKAQYLRCLAELQGEYLGNPIQAKADIEQALALQPDDANLAAARENFARGCGEIFGPQGKH